MKKTKSILIFVLSALLSLSLAIFAACGDTTGGSGNSGGSSDACEHKVTYVKPDISATCTTEGRGYLTCEDCGKRLSDKQGNIIFTGVTLSSTEEDILKQYVKDAAETFVSSFSPLIASYTDNTDDVVFIYQRNRVSDGKANAFCSLFKSYVVDYVAYSVLSMTYADSARKYADDMTNHVVSALKLIFQKDAPTSGSKTMEDMTGEVILN